MKTKILFPLLTLLALPFFSCKNAANDVLDGISEKLEDLRYPSRVALDDDIYVRGFYNEDLLFNIYEKSPADVIREDDKRVYYRPPHASLTLLAYSTIRNENPSVNFLYCLEGQKSAAESYYADGSSHWVYYCGTGTDQTDRVVRTVPGASAANFDALIRFCKANCYEPFNDTKNSSIQKVSFPMPGGAIPEVVFYKKSDDGLISSGMNDSLHILDGRLYLVYTYDFDRQNDGRNARIEAVALPDDLEAYFRTLARSYGL